MATGGDAGDGQDRATRRVRVKTYTATNTAQPMYIYRVIADGKICERLELVRCSAGGWKRYRSDDIGEFSTREWYSCTCPIDALCYYINQRARRMVTANTLSSRLLRDQIENATNTIQNHARAERSRQEQKDARMCGY